ncbi:hypothetical protein GTW59_39545, partial [Streptomyces sp. SID89]|nr:hypothetical protein [Streptomyces sp. SID89]
MTAPHDGVDPLLAAILDDPPPDPASHDAAYLTEYEAARTDLATLRKHLNLLADALTADPLGPAPPQGPAPAPASAPAPGSVSASGSVSAAASAPPTDSGR